ncbi:hypothetical protein MnTg02_01240 [bacterium MnTg02]|nr:hypothetical protein MnTg02_01240 [bacterium MnTg02]
MQTSEIVNVAPHRPDPAFLGKDHHDGLLLDHRCRDIDIEDGRHGKSGPPLSGFGFLSEFFFNLLDLARDAAPLLVVRFQESLELLAFLGKRTMLLLDLHFLELSQGSQPHIENGLGLNVGQGERRHHFFFWLVFLSNDANDFI